MNKIQVSSIAATMSASFLWAFLPLIAQQPATPGAPPPGGGGRGGGKAAPKDTAPKGPAPRMADGKVDFSGNWAPNAINENVDLARVLCGAQPAPCGNPPMLPWADKLYRERKGDLSKDDPEGYCLPPGVPRMSTTPYPWSMIQTDRVLVIVYEGGAHIWRKIFL